MTERLALDPDPDRELDSILKGLALADGDLFDVDGQVSATHGQALARAVTGGSAQGRRSAWRPQLVDVNFIHPSATTRSPHRPPWLTASVS
jgi:hypothetical protein